jgi:hypothetical protein
VSEKAVRIAAQLYETRDAMRSLLGDRYRERCAAWVQSINLTMQRHGCDELTAALILAKDFTRDDGKPYVLLAAAVEMVEGIFSLPKPGAVVRYHTLHRADPSKTAEGAAMVVKHMTAANAPSPHLRPTERMLFVRGCGGGAMQSQHFLIKASEVLP